MSIDRSTAWALLSQRAGPTVVLAEMSYGPEADSDVLRIGSSLVTLEGNDYLPLIANMPHRFQEVDFWTREFSISDLSLEILNMPFLGDTRFSDLFDERGAGNDRGFENRQVAVVLWKLGITTWDDCFELFPVGVMRKPTTQGSTAIVEVQDHTFLTLNNIELDRMTDSDAADTDEGLPEESRGKTKPRIYGNHINPKGDNSKASDSALSENNLVPAVYKGIDASGNSLWQISDHIINEINAEGDDSEQQQIWGKDPTTGRFVRLKTTFTVPQNDSSGCIISVPANASYYDHWYAKGTPTTAISGSVTDYDTPANMANKDFSTKAICSLDFGGAGGDKVEATFTFTEYDNSSLQKAGSTDDGLSPALVDIDICWYGLITFGGTMGTGDYKIEGTTANTPADDIGFTKPEGGSYPDLRLVNNFSDTTPAGSPGADTVESIGNDFVLRIEKNNAFPAGPDKVTFDVYQVYKRIELTPNVVLPIYFGGKAKEIDANWTNRAVVDGYDEQHADHGGSGNLAENPATLIELTLRNEAGLGDSRLNLNSFNTASNTEVSSLVGAPVFLEQPDSYLQALFALVQQYRGFFWWTPSGELFLKILEDDYTTPDKTIDGDLITNLKYGRTDINRLYTAMQMLYNEIDGANLIETALVEDTTAQTWYNITQAQSLRKQPAHGFNLNGAASAVSVGGYFLANQMNIHNTVEAQLPLMFNHLDIGDLIGFENLPENLRGEDLSASYTIAGQTIRPFFLINSVDRSDEITLEGFQVHKLD